MEAGALTEGRELAHPEKGTKCYNTLNCSFIMTLVLGWFALMVVVEVYRSYTITT